jgi:hypothetical protein
MKVPIILLKFLVIILRVLRLEVSTFGFGFLRNSRVINKQEFSSLIDCYVRLRNHRGGMVFQAVEISSTRKPNVGNKI